MSRDATTQSDLEMGTRTISVQTRERGEWKKVEHGEKIIIPSKTFIAGSGKSSAGKSVQTRTSTLVDNCTQTGARYAWKPEKRRDHGLWLTHVTDETIRAWTPGDTLKAKLRRKERLLGELF